MVNVRENHGKPIHPTWLCEPGLWLVKSWRKHLTRGWCSAPDSCPSRVASARDTSDQTSFPLAASVEPESADLGSLSAKCLLTFQVLKVYVLSARGSKCSGLAIFITWEQGVDDTKRHFFRWWNSVLFYEPSILSFQEAKGTFVLIEFAELLLGHGLQQKITPPPPTMKGCKIQDGLWT